MPARFRTKDRVLETSVTTGVGSYALAGAVTGYQPFIGGSVASGDLVPYFAEDGTNWEIGIGTVTSGPSTLARTNVIRSSNADAAVNWGAGTKNLRCGFGADLGTQRVNSVSIAGAAGTQVLSQTEQRCDVLILTGALTGNRAIEVDTCPWYWGSVVNLTTGAFTVTLKVNGATGVAITQNKSRPLYNDGTDVKDPFLDVSTPTIASQAEAEAGVENTKMMTALRVAQAIAALAGASTQATPQNTTSGSSIDFTGIPAGTKLIIIPFNQVSGSGTANLLVQIGDSGGIESSGYTSGAGQDGGAGRATSTSGFILTSNTIAAQSHSGLLILARLDATNNIWGALAILVNTGTPVNFLAGGVKALSAELDRFRLTTTGADTFDNGSIGAVYYK